MVVSRGGDEPLQASYAFKAQHSPFLPLKGLVLIPSSVVEPVASFLPIGVANDLHRSAVVTQLVGDKCLSFTVVFHSFIEELQCCFMVEALLLVAFRHLTLMIHSPPKIVRFITNLLKNFAKVPLPVRVGVHLFNTRLAYLVREQLAKFIPP